MRPHETTASMPETASGAPATLKPWHDRLNDPRILFPVIAIVLLIIIWSTAWVLIDSEYRSAKQNAEASTVKLAYTYEAQVVRALREIDLTLKFVQYAYETGAQASVLTNLAARNLLPPDLLFVVSITDAEGNIVASTRDSGLGTLAGQDYFQAQRQADAFLISPPQPAETSETWSLHFSRRLVAADGSFAGIAMVMVDAAYFVSGYESADLGAEGVLAILGTDGIFRARRTGEAIFYGDAVDYAAVVATADEASAPVSINPWDDVQRYTSARELFAFPLAILVGLSEREQLGAIRQRVNTQLWQSGIGSVLVLIAMTVLGRLSWQLQQSRLRLMAEQVANAQQVEYLAYHDSLTGLANRSLFSKLLSHSFSQARRNRRPLSLLFMDLDRFKLINDTLGHDAGDELLVEVAHRLNSSVRASDTVARLGGDEFVVLLPELNDEKQLITVATKILAAVRRPFMLAGQELRISVSIGISTYPKDGEDEQTLIRNADIAMYNAKKEGRNVFRFYADELNTNSLEHLALESNLRLALERNEFRLHYQVRRNIGNNSLTGVEALLRWQHPQLGLLAPELFLPLAEKSGLIIPIGKWVLETACRQSMAWKAEGLSALHMAVSLSAREFHDDDLLQTITEVLQKTGMDPQLLNLEVAESVLMRDFDNALLILGKITALGIRISIDKFGAGYASLAMLRQFHLDTIKVDESFIRDITGNAEDRHLIEAIITMARTLGLKVVAEGVATGEQASFLGENACDEMQGIFVSDALPANELAALLQA